MNKTKQYDSCKTRPGNMSYFSFPSLIYEALHCPQFYSAASWLASAAYRRYVKKMVGVCKVRVC